MFLTCLFLFEAGSSVNAQVTKIFTAHVIDSSFTKLERKTDKERFSQFCDSLMTHPNITGEAEADFAKTGLWSLLYYRRYGWTSSSIGHSVAIDEVYIKNNPEDVYTTKNLFDTLQIDSVITKNFKDFFYILSVPRDDPFNRKWFAISPQKNFLIVRYIGSLPNDNGYSFAIAREYYFKKAE